MYDNLEQITTQRRFLPTQRHYPTSRLHECYAVEPWQKNTIEIELREQDLPRQAKTFYHVPKARIFQRQYSTQRNFHFDKQDQSRVISKPKSLAQVSRKSAISHYNISGNILGQALRAIPKSLPFELPAKRIRSLRSKQKINPKITDQINPISACESVMAIKRKISEKKEKSDQGFIRLNSENDEQVPKIQFNMKRTKVISLGYQKLHQYRGISKKRSIQLNSTAIIV